MGWNLPPGVTDRMIDEAQPGYDAEPEGPSELDLVYEDLHKAQALLKRAQTELADYATTYPAFRLRPIGQEGSSARHAQAYGIVREDRTRAILTEIDVLLAGAAQ